MRELPTFLENTLPELDPVIHHEMTDYGWRALTQAGEILEVRGSNGHKASVPDEIIVARGGVPIGRRAVSNDASINIDNYVLYFNTTVSQYKNNNLLSALRISGKTLHEAATSRAKFNRAMILLASGRWTEGFKTYYKCEQNIAFMRPAVRAALGRELKPWQGESVQGKRLLLLHAHGFGDTIMMLRYLPKLRAMGADVRLQVPFPLQRLTQWRNTDDECDYFCPFLHLLHFLRVTPDNVCGKPYLDAGRLKTGGRRKIGIAWSVSVASDSDYPREVPLVQLVKALGDVELHSVQTQGAEEAQALGVHTHTFTDFADCAALMMQMDAVVSVDTAALHLAGAIGHPCVFGLLSYWSSWRWIAPWYDNVKLCRQSDPGDDALAQIHNC